MTDRMSSAAHPQPLEDIEMVTMSAGKEGVPVPSAPVAVKTEAQIDADAAVLERCSEMENTVRESAFVHFEVDDRCILA